jgi:hypothetical protein
MPVAIVKPIVKRSLLVLLMGLLLAGCATNSIESRRQERPASYANFSPELQALVNAGQIRRGMNEDAVYIAWGKPAQVVQVEDQNGLQAIWIYTGGWMEETRYWYPHRRFPETDYQPRTYVRAELVFVGGLLQSWRTLPQPVY